MKIQYPAKCSGGPIYHLALLLCMKMCGGAGVESFDWNKGYCDKGTKAGDGRACCASAVCTPSQECKSSWDVDCLIPMVGWQMMEPQILQNLKPLEADYTSMCIHC